MYTQLLIKYYENISPLESLKLNPIDGVWIVRRWHNGSFFEGKQDGGDLIRSRRESNLVI